MMDLPPTPKPVPLGAEASGLRFRLLADLVTAEEIVAWADAEIRKLPKPTEPWFRVSLAGSKGQEELFSGLRELAEAEGGNRIHLEGFRLFCRELRTRIAQGKLSHGEVVNLLYRAAFHGGVPLPEEIEKFCSWISAEYDLLESGYKERWPVDRELVRFLEEVASPPSSAERKFSERDVMTLSWAATSLVAFPAILGFTVIFYIGHREDSYLPVFLISLMSLTFLGGAYFLPMAWKVQAVLFGSTPGEKSSEANHEDGRRPARLARTALLSLVIGGASACLLWEWGMVPAWLTPYLGGIAAAIPLLAMRFLIYRLLRHWGVHA